MIQRTNHEQSWGSRIGYNGIAGITARTALEGGSVKFLCARILKFAQPI